ncbi:ATP-binding protein [Paraburkholderia sp. JHI2823]|uniref:hybrid sensor histidine kinase/response regulator n=1 Tax=Paraburkholderia sp. JHI2823 TaxID=3112960 RepID=UPI003180B9D4
MAMSGPSSPVNRVRTAGALITAQLDVRARRSPDYAAENEALHALAQALTTSHLAMLQKLVDAALTLCGAGSAGITLRVRGAGQESSFRWIAVAGRCAAVKGHLVATDESPAGVAIALNSPQLFAFPKRYFDCLARIVPEVTEELVVPVPGTPEALGVLWVMSHDSHRFDSEHRRILTSLANFTCAALTIARSKADAEARAVEAETARNALSKAESARDKFIAALGHELRGPLAPIDSALQAAEKLASGSPAVLSALALANRQMQQLKRIISDLLDAERCRHGKLSVRLASALLGDIVKDAVGEVNEVALHHRHQLRVMLPPYPVTVLADAGRLTQVVSNVLMNAVKYTPPGGEVTLEANAPDPGTIPEDDATPRDLVIRIRDNGIGISRELLPHVFDIFFQADSARMRAEGGLGLGLSVVKSLVHAHRGDVSVWSDGEGKGTEVTLRLPVVHRSPFARFAPTHRIPPARILLVDDNADATEALAMLLTLDGHNVRQAHDGPEALAVVESFTPDIALIDVNMPGMDGYQLAARLRQLARCASTRLVALTGHRPVTGAHGAPAGFDCYLLKPASPDDLAEALRQ